MRILLDATSTDPGPSGARTRLVHLLGAYVRLDSKHPIIVLTPRGRGLTSELAVAGVECFEVDPAPSAVVRLRRTADHLDDLVRHFCAEALHYETLPVPQFTAGKLILTLHDLRALEEPAWSPRAIYARFALPKAIASVDRVIAVSHDTAGLVESALGYPATHISVVPNAPDPEVHCDDDPALRRALFQRFALPDRFVLALGHVEPRKNLALLIEAVRLLRRRESTRDVGLVVCGREEVGLGERLRELAARDPPVPLLLTGALAPEARNALLSLAACVATPSLVEGFGLVPLEAMQAGIPVVVARSRALPEVVGDGALVCDPADPRDLGNRLFELLTDEALRRELVARGHARTREFTWENAALALRSAYDEVAATLDDEN